MMFKGHTLNKLCKTKILANNSLIIVIKTAIPQQPYLINHIVFIVRVYQKKN